ncbi:hypothetical protein LTR40_014662, partial [Exophiala xenobiotica]
LGVSAWEVLLRDAPALPPLPNSRIDLGGGDAVSDKPEGHTQFCLDVTIAALVVEEEHVGEGDCSGTAVFFGRGGLDPTEMRRFAAWVDLAVGEEVDGAEGFGV